MHNIEPHYNWREEYVAEQDERSPFYGRTYSEFEYSSKIYNYFIHPQWDPFGSSTLYLKIIFVDYAEGYAIIELLGEWNDCLQNDIMFLKREIIDALQLEEIYKFIIIGENLLNFHSGDDCYYQEWYEDVKEYDGWISFVNFRDHVIDEMTTINLQHFINFDDPFNDINWRPNKPQLFFKTVENYILNPSQYLLTN